MRDLGFVLIIVAILFKRVLCELEFKYHSNTELAEILQMFNGTVDSPLRTNVYSIGRTIDGNDLWVAEITAVEEGALKIPNVKYIGNIHGNEVVGREVLLHFLYYLRDEYHSGNTTIISLLNTTRIHILPTMNPDGFNRSRIGQCETSEGRKNGKGHVDLNRSFEDFYHINPIKPQPETKAVMQWMEKTPFVLSASLHGGALVVNYPYDTVREISSNYYKEDLPSITPDDDVFKYLSTVYAKHNKEMGKFCGYYDTEFKGGIINGALWYSLVGGMQDYNYFKHGCMEITIEISCCKYPLANELPKLWDDNKEALVAFCQQAHRGVYGQVLDKDTRIPIGDAQMKMSGRNMSFSSFASTGEYWRILLPGNYTIEVKAEGYYDHIVPVEITPEELKLEMDILLTNSSSSTTTATIISTKATEPVQVETVASTNFKDTTDDLSILCELPHRRTSRDLDCKNVEVAQMLLNNSARACVFSLGLLIIVCFIVFI